MRQQRMEDFQFDEKELAILNKRFSKAVSTVWMDKMGWQLTEEAGANVITVKADISDLYLYASIKNDEPYSKNPTPKKPAA